MYSHIHIYARKRGDEAVGGTYRELKHALQAAGALQPGRQMPQSASGARQPAVRRLRVGAGEDEGSRRAAEDEDSRRAAGEAESKAALLRTLSSRATVALAHCIVNSLNRHTISTPSTLVATVLISTCIHTHTHTHTHTCMYICICMCICMYVRMYV